ncbi:hypothetical protein K1719_036332 [Acacia pycnantha]|nr:hypothetical protein K1719_036332 [Acacia pycnantha]
MSPTNNPLSLISKQQSFLLEDGWKIPSPLGTTSNCVDISRRENCLENLLIHIGKNSQVFHMLSERVLQGLSLTKYSDDVCILPNDNYPYWLTFMGEGASVKFKVPPVNDDQIKSLEEAEGKERISNLEFDDEVEVIAIVRNGFIVKKTTVYLILTDSFDEKMETSTFDAINLTGTKHKCEKE